MKTEITFNEMMKFTNSTVEEQARFLAEHQIESYWEACLGMLIHDPSHRYQIFGELLHLENAPDLLKRMFSVMGDLITAETLKASGNCSNLKDIISSVGLEDETLIEMLKNSGKLRQKILVLLQKHPKDQMLQTIAAKQFEEYNETLKWTGNPTKEFVEMLNEDLRGCRRCKTAIKDTIAIIEKDDVYHLKCHPDDGHKTIRNLINRVHS